MCDLTDVLIGNCDDENPGGVSSIAWAIPLGQLDTHAVTYAEDATVFDEVTAYSEDDLVLYQGEVYKCTNAAYSAGAWDVADWEKIPNGNVRVNGTHVPASGKGFAKLELNDEESLLNFETLGKKFNRSGKITAQLFHPGSSEEAAEFAAIVKKARNVVVLVPLPNGKTVQLGTKNSYAEIVPSYTSGTRENPDSRWLFEVSCYASSLVYYESTVPTP
jgi:hypothetical protein